MKYLFVYLWIAFYIYSHAGTYTATAMMHSAYRGPNESAQSAFQRYRQRLANHGVRRILEDTPLGKAVPLSMLTFEHVPGYSTGTVATQVFAKLRDERFIKDTTHAMLRRSSWLFPDDGCFARAALAVQNIQQWAMPVPAKLFIFGNLTVRTPNSPNGSVSWWYHVVPVVMVGQQPVVFDPAINPSAPLLLKDWVKTMVPEEKSATFSICHPSSYSPASPCTVESNSSLPALDHQVEYLKMEWQRLLDLKRDPTKELADHPPWSTAKKGARP